jgi:CBS domain-containing membrane protein
MRVQDLMRSHVVTLRMDESLDVATDIMNMGRIRHLPVVRSENQLVGIVTQRDLFKAGISSVLDLGNSRQKEWLGKVPVVHVMSRNVTTIGPTASVSEALQVLIEHKYGCLPVVKHGKLVGLITETDFLRCFGDLLKAGKFKDQLS